MRGILSDRVNDGYGTAPFAAEIDAEEHHQHDRGTGEYTGENAAECRSGNHVYMVLF